MPELRTTSDQSFPGGVRIGGAAREKPLLPRPPAWMAQGACLGMDVNIFFPTERGRTNAEAQRTCAGCPVRLECRDWATERGEEHGVFGGETPKERHVRAGQIRAAGAAA